MILLRRFEVSNSKGLRIGIIGAGPGGLAAAEALREKGYNNVTILEKENRVGGMSLSLSYETPDHNKVIYEMGSLQPVSSKILYRLMKNYRLHIGKNNLGKNQNPDDPMFIKIYSLTQHKTIIDFATYKFGYPFRNAVPIFLDLIKFMRYLFKYRQLINPGFKLSNQHLIELSIPYEQWVDERQFKIIGDLLKMLGSTVTFSNPALKNTMPALMPIKFFLQLLQWPPTHLRYLNGTLKQMREGYQELWNRVAKMHTVLLNVNIKKVIRKDNIIEVDVGDTKLVFDKIIITCSPTQAEKFLDITEEEKQLFSKINYAPGWRVSFLGKNLPHDGLYAFLEPYMVKDHEPCLQCFYPEGEVGDGIWLYTGVINVNKKHTLQSIKQDAEKCFHDQFHGELIKWLDAMYWPEYVPYFNGDEIQNGIYQKLESLQGKNDTYYGGGTFSSSTHGSVVDYAYSSIKKYFGD